jgi:hypothetical protein
MRFLRVPCGRIVFGARVTQEQRVAVIRDMSSDPLFGHVGFAAALLDPREFKVDIRSLDRMGVPVH